MNPDDAVPVPRRQGVDPVLVWPVTMGHVKRVGIPFLLSIPLAKALPVANPMVLVAGVGAISLLLALLRIEGVPFDRWLRNRIRYHRGQTESDPVVDGDWLATSSGRSATRYHVMARLESPTFHLLNEASKASLLSSLQQFYGGLECSLQIASTTRPTNPLGHMRLVSSNAQTPQSRRHAKRYLAWLESFLRHNNIQDRETIAVFSIQATGQQGTRSLDVENRLRQLDSTAQALLRVLQNHGGNGHILTPQDALAVVKRSRRCPDYPAWSLAGAALNAETPPTRQPGGRLVSKDRIQEGDNHVRVLTLQGYPDALPVAWLDPILALRERITASIHVEPKPPWLVRRHLVRSRNDLSYKIQKKQRAGADVTEELQVLDSLEEQLELVTAGRARYHEATILLQLVAPSHRELDRLTAEVQVHLRNTGIHATAESWSQARARHACLPTGGNHQAYHSQTMDDLSVAAIQPFLYGTIRHPRGALVGFHAQSGSPIFLDAWTIVPHNRIVAGISGAGKSYNVKLDILRTRQLRPEALAFVIDPLREFRDAVLALGGQNILIGDPGTIINPLQLQGAPDASRNALSEKLDFLESFFALALPGTTQYQQSVLHTELRVLYAQVGIHEDSATHTRTPPTLSQLLAHLRSPGQRDEGVLEACRSLVVHLEPRIHGPLKCLDGQSNVQLTANLVNFDLRDMDKTWQALHMHVVLDYLQQRLYQAIATPKMLYIDEAWKLLDYEETARTINHLSRHVRHYNAGLTLITQTPESLLRSEHGRAFLLNCQQTILFRQRSVPDDVRRAYGLDHEDAQLLTRIGKAEHMDHSEAMYIIGDQKLLVACVASPTEHALITTRPGEVTGGAS